MTGPLGTDTEFTSTLPALEMPRCPSKAESSSSLFWCGPTLIGPTHYLSPVRGKADIMVEQVVPACSSAKDSCSSSELSPHLSSKCLNYSRTLLFYTVLDKAA